MGIFKRNGVYYIDYRIQGRRFRKRIGANKQLAKDTLATIEGDKVRGYYRIKKAQRVRFSDFAKTYMDHIKAIRKISWLRDQVALKSMMPHFGQCYLDDINPRLIEDYQGKRVKHVQPSSVNREMIVLRFLLNLAIKWDMLHSNPFKNVRFLRVDNVQDRILTDEEVGKLLRACNGHVYPIVFTALHTGMRLGEILTLKWSQVDFEQEGITVVITKNNRTRKIPINAVLMAMLKDLKVKSTSDYVFVFERSNLPVTSIKTAFNKAVKRAGAPHFTMHSLRHTCASNWIKGGVDLVTVKELLGHQSITTTMRYAHSAPESKKRAVAVSERLVREDGGHYLDTLAKSLKPPVPQIIRKHKVAAVAQLVERRSRKA